MSKGIKIMEHYISNMHTNLWCRLVFWFCLCISVSGNPSIDAVPRVLSFEDPSELDYFAFPNSSVLITSTKHYKDGFHSMLWRWGPGDELKLNTKQRLHGQHAGVKFWIYRNEISVANLSISLIDSKSRRGMEVVLKFNFSLNFTGWRAAWVALLEAKRLPKHPGYDQIVFAAPSTGETSSRVIFVDLLCITDHVVMQSRDEIIPPISDGIYTIKKRWQQTYRWSLVVPPAVNGSKPLTEKELEQLSDLYLIEKRLVNWFANESIRTSQFRGLVLKRWKSLVVLRFQEARVYLQELNISVSSDGVVTGSPLFMKRSQFGQSIQNTTGRNKKLGDVTFHVLFPLTLEYYFSIQPNSIRDTVRRELANINSVARRGFAMKRITKHHSKFAEFLVSEIGKFRMPLTQAQFRRALGNLNRRKLDTIMLLLEYIKDQGWTKGSAMGSLDHAMNKVGSGFMNSLFLLRQQLSEVGKLGEILNTMKWYNDFGEIYQSNFEYAGTTADKLRTKMLYRLETILMSAQGTVYEKRAKLRDMTAYSRWCNNALLAHPAFSAVFKPDLSCFHHLGIYGSAYSPGALTVSSLIWYLVEDTSFSLNANSKENIRERLLSYERIAPKYSLPNSICGRMPNYSKAILTTMLQAYAFFSIRPQNLTDNGELEDVRPDNDTEMIRIFLRLFHPLDPKVSIQLGESMPHRDEYTSSIGSLQVLLSLYRKAKKAKMEPAEPRTGHWVQNFAAFSIHRRKHWVVTVKGFSRYVWDFEDSETKNLYGMYQSHCALQISNSEASLNAYDVQHGWDWTRVPGTTTIKLSLKKMISHPGMRYYQPSKLVGGVVLTSKDPRLANGVFAMKFRQPSYGRDGKTGRERKKTKRCKRKNNESPNEEFVFTNLTQEESDGNALKDVKREIKFTFRKSVFFYNSLIVCLGSNIRTRNSERYPTQTTLFQDKYIYNFSAIYVNGKMKLLNRDYSQILYNSSAILDTNGNGYYIPKGSSANIAIGRQKSMASDGRTPTEARYATVWLDHGVNPVSARYEYAIVVSADVYSMEAFRKAQTSGKPVYEVLRKNSAAHVVRFAGNTANPSETYGYAFFKRNVSLCEGPVKSVSAQCLLMAEVDKPNFSSMNLSISSPDLNYNTSKKLKNSDDNGVNEYFYMKSQPVKISVFVRRPVVLQRVLVNGKSVETSLYDDYIFVRPDDPQHPTLGGREIVFKRLINGESVEAFLEVPKNDEQKLLNNSVQIT